MLPQLLLFIVFCIFAGVVVFGTFVVLYHFQRFRFQGNTHRGRILMFLIGSAVFVLLEISFVNAVSWQDVFNLITHNRFTQ